MTVYDIGDRARLTLTLRDITGTLANGTVVLTVTDPAGTVTNPAVTNDSVGQYHADVDLPTRGEWVYRWVSTGAVIAAEDGWLIVEASAAATGYTTVAELKSRLLGIGSADTSNDALLERAVIVASRAIDKYCGRIGDGFTSATTATARRFRVEYSQDLLFTDDISTTTGLVVKVGYPGAYGQTLTLDVDYVVEPTNAIAKGYPIYALRHTRNYAWAWSNWFSYNNLPNVEVTAAWGWPRVPDEVREATLIKATRLFRRKDSPDGVIGNPDFGTVYISRFEDPDVISLLDGLERVSV